MNQVAPMQSGAQSIEEHMRGELAQADLVAGTLGPILRHLLANDDHSLFSDEIVARVRGMIGDVARQLLLAQAIEAEDPDPGAFCEDRGDDLSDLLFDHQPLLAYAHALALEWQLTRRLQARNALDPVLTPLLQSQISSSDPSTANAAMSALAAQARFIQQQRRMELPLGELPGDLLHACLLTLRSFQNDASDPAVERACEGLRRQFDESRSRAGIMAQLVMGMGSRASKSLSVIHAGVAFFVTALAIASGQDRAMAILATNDRQMPRLALALRAAGLDLAAIEEQFAYLHPDRALPEAFAQLRSDRASALLMGTHPMDGA